MSGYRINHALFGQSVNNRLASGAVDVSINSECQEWPCNSTDNYAEWTMRLQRQITSRTGYKYYSTIATRTGYVSQQSPSNRVFTNIANRGRIRVSTSMRTNGSQFFLTDMVKY